MKRHGSYVAALLFTIIALLGWNTSHVQAAKMLDYGDPLPDAMTMPQPTIQKEFCEEITKRTGGELTVKYHHATIVTNEVKAVEMLKRGALAFASLGGAVGTTFPNTQPLVLPYLFRDYAHFHAVLAGPVVKKMEEEIEKQHGLKVLFWFDFGFRQFITTKKPVGALSDLKGLKLRVMPSPPLAELVNSLGASAVPISWAETIPALQQGVVDGLDLPIVSFLANRVYEISKNMALTSHYFAPTPALVNLKVWNEFTPAQQQIVRQVAKEMSAKQRMLMEKSHEEGLETMKKYGVNVTSPDTAPFRKVAQEKVYPKYYEKFGKELIESIVATK
jgi:tripartite ATP-independent transporter DctP family solute receptor